MKKLSTLLKLVAIVLFMGAWHTTTWAQDALQLTAGAPQVTQNFDGMWDGQQATLDMPQGWLGGWSVHHCGWRYPMHQCDDLPAQCG